MVGVLHVRETEISFTDARVLLLYGHQLAISIRRLTEKNLNYFMF